MGGMTENSHQASRIRASRSAGRDRGAAGGDSACNRGVLGGRWAGEEAAFQRVVPLNVSGNYYTDFSGPSCQDFGKQDRDRTRATREVAAEKRAKRVWTLPSRI